MSFETGTSFVAIDMADSALEFSAIPTTVPQVICFPTIVAASLVRLRTLTVMALVSRHMGWSMWLYKTKCLIQGRQEYPGPLLIKMVFVSSQTGCQSMRYSSSCKSTVMAEKKDVCNWVSQAREVAIQAFGCWRSAARNLVVPIDIKKNLYKLLNCLYQ